MISYQLDLTRYTKYELHQMYQDNVITYQELKQEFTKRNILR